MTIVRSGYAKRKRNGSTRAHRTARAITIAGATHCGICHHPFTTSDIIEADHIVPHSAGGPDHPANYRPVHRTCNRTRGAGA